MEISGKNVLLTGATGGLGRAMAHRLAYCGARLKLSARDGEALAGLAAELPGSGHTTAVSDLGQPDAAAQLAAAVGPVDCLIANAALPATGRLTDLSGEQVARMLRINLESPILLTRALLPGMVERDRGRIVLIGSLAGKAGSPRSSIYNATKFGLRGFAFGMGADLAGSGVGITVVAPGFVREAGMFADSGASAPAGMGTTTPDQVADAVVKAIEGDRLEITVAPALQRTMAHIGLSARASPTGPSLAGPARGRPTTSPRARLTSDNPTNDRTREEPMSSNSFGAQAALEVDGKNYEIHRLDALQERFDVARLPYSIKVLLENVLRLEDGLSVTAADVEAIASWDAAAEPSVEIPFQPARVLMQDFTGVPAVVDLAAMRDAIDEIGGDPTAINPLVDVDLVIDHSVQVDAFGSGMAFEVNAEREFERNQERYEFLKWGQKSFDNFSVVPPATGICHQVNLEYIAQVVYSRERDGVISAYPDTLVGTDSHTTMVNGLGVLGWGVGGIEAEAAMLGQPVSMLLPQVVGFKLSGKLPDGATATDLVLTVTEMLRERGVVSKFVEFYGPGLPTLPLADRATLGNMSPEFGSTCAIFPPDAETLRYLELTGRPTETIALVDAYAREQGMFHTAESEDPVFSDTLELELDSVVPSIAGPKRPQDRVSLSDAKPAFLEALAEFDSDAAQELSPLDEALEESFPASDPPAEDVSSDLGKPHHSPERVPAAVLERSSRDSVPVTLEDGTSFDLDHGRVVIAAITSCTNTSNPYVMVAAGLLARNALAREVSSESPGSRPRSRRARPWSPTTSTMPASPSISTACSSTWSATAAPPASATPARSTRRSRPRSTRRIWSSARCSPATGTSRAGSARTSRPTTSPRRRWSSPMRWPAAWTSTSRPTRSARTRTATRST